MKALIVAALALGMTQFALAHPEDAPEREMDIDQIKERFEQNREKRLEIMEKVQEVREERIREHFELNDKQFDTLFDSLTEFDQARFEAQDAKKLAMLELKVEMSKEDPDSATVGDLLDRLEDAENALIDARALKMKQLKKTLEPVDRAKFLHMEHRFERAIKHKIRERMEGQRRQRRGEFRERGELRERRGQREF